MPFFFQQELGSKANPPITATERSQLNPPTLPLGLIPATHSDNKEASEFSVYSQPCTVLPGPGAPLRPRKKRSSPIQGETLATHAPARPSTAPAGTRVRLRSSPGSEPRKLKLKLAFAERQILKR